MTYEEIGITVRLVQTSKESCRHFAQQDMDGACHAEDPRLKPQATNMPAFGAPGREPEHALRPCVGMHLEHVRASHAEASHSEA